MTTDDKPIALSDDDLGLVSGGGPGPFGGFTGSGFEIQLPGGPFDPTAIGQQMQDQIRQQVEAFAKFTRVGPFAN